VDTAYVRTDPSSNANYQLGLTYERMMRLDSARAVFVRGRAAAPNSRVAPLMARRADYLNRYFILRSDLAKFDSVKAVLLAPPPAEEKPDSAATDTSAAARARPKPATPQKPALTLDSVNVRLANTKNELASLFYLTMNIPDSAAYWYRTLISDHPQSPVIPRAMFSLAEIMGHDTLASTQPADSIYHAIIDRYPHSEYAAEARRILGLAPIVSATDTAGVLLRDAEQKYLAGDYAGAIAGYRTVVDAHPTSTYAPRAQYAVGWLYEEYTTEVDSAIENYRRLMSQYPTDPLAYRIQPRLFEVDQYRKAIADSIAAVEREKAAAAARDSIAALMKDSVAVAPADSAATVPPEDQLPPAADTTGGTRAVPDTVKNLRQRN
jgi:tetratricopeptide (TPR) repeat protein